MENKSEEKVDEEVLIDTPEKKRKISYIVDSKLQVIDEFGHKSNEDVLKDLKNKKMIMKKLEQE